MVYAGQAIIEVGWWTFMGFGLVYAAFIMVGILLLKRLTAREAE